MKHVQREACAKHAGAARYAGGWDARSRRTKRPTAIDLHRELNALKKTELPWMYEVSKCAPQEALRNLDKALDNFFRRVQLKKEGKWRGPLGFPRFKAKKHGLGSFGLTGAIHVFDNAIQLAGIGLGIKTLAAVSDGTRIKNPRALKSGLRKIKRLQRTVSGRLKGSANRRKALRQLAKAHLRVANIRKDALHQATGKLTKTKSAIVLEDLNVSGMLRNHHLAQAIADVGLYEFPRQMSCKRHWYGCEVLLADP